MEARCYKNICANINKNLRNRTDNSTTCISLTIATARNKDIFYWYVCARKLVSTRILFSIVYEGIGRKCHTPGKQGQNSVSPFQYQVKGQRALWGKWQILGLRRGHTGWPRSIIWPHKVRIAQIAKQWVYVKGIQVPTPIAPGGRHQNNPSNKINNKVFGSNPKYKTNILKSTLTNDGGGLTAAPSTDK